MARPAGSAPPPERGAGRGLLAISQDGPTTARGRKTRSALIHAAREVFEEMGFRDARIQDIAARAGTSYGVFYHYFKTKEAVLGELFTSVTGEMFTASQVPRNGPSDPWSRIADANRRYLAVARRNARLLAVIEELAVRDPQFRQLKMSIREPFLARSEAGIQRLQARGWADPDLDPRLTATMLGGMLEHFSLLWYVHGVAYDEEVAIEALTRLWGQALGLRHGQDMSAQGD